MASVGNGFGRLQNVTVLAGAVGKKQDKQGARFSQENANWFGSGGKVERNDLEAAQLRALVQKDGLAVREAGRRLFPTLTRSKAERLAKEFGIVSARGMRWVKLLSLSQIPPSKQIAFSLPTGVRWASLM
jgi:hypothetical protein